MKYLYIAIISFSLCAMENQREELVPLIDADLARILANVEMPLEEGSADLSNRTVTELSDRLINCYNSVMEGNSTKQEVIICIDAMYFIMCKLDIDHSFHDQEAVAFKPWRNGHPYN